MLQREVIEELQSGLTHKIKLQEPMLNHTSLRVGGPVDGLTEVFTEEELKHLLRVIKKYEIPYLVIGGGTNLLIRDEGFRGVAIKLKGEFERVEVRDADVVSGGGVPLPSLVGRVCRLGLSGLEFATGIPGTVGGAVVGNAGAYGESIGERVKWIKVLTKDGKILIKDREKLLFRYRDSNLRDYIVMYACFSLSKKNHDSLKPE
jgi:UDP-N-acetylmuramate dehydrogenase